MLIQLDYMREGVSQAEARRMAETDILRLKALEQAADESLTQHARDKAQRLLEALDTSERLRQEGDAITRSFDAAAAAAARITDALGAARSAAGGLRGGIADLRAEIGALEAGMDRFGAAATVDLQRELRALGPALASGDVFERVDAQLRAKEIEGLLGERAELLRRRQELTTTPSGGGGGGGAAAQELQTFESIVGEMTKRIEREQQLLQVRGQARTLLEAEFALRDALESAEVSYSEAALQRAAAEIAAGNEKIAMLQQQEAMAQQLENAFQNFFTSVITGTNSFKGALSQLLGQLAQMAANAAFQSLLNSSAGDGGNFFSNIVRAFANADGNAYAGGRVIPFARGGVVNSPTLFPMAGANTGLMGEAGPEAIMPLKRGADGRLGIESSGGGAVSVTYAPQITVRGSGEEVAALRAEIARMNAEAPARIVATVKQAQKKRVL
jgi:phage-related minor tail protein